MRAYGPRSVCAASAAGSRTPSDQRGADESEPRLCHARHASGGETRRFATAIASNPPSGAVPLAARLRRGRIVAAHGLAVRTPVARRRCSSRRIVVVAVPPVDELDLVGPLQVFNSVNRLAGRTIYTIEVVTTPTRLTVEGEGGVLTFVARHHFSKVAGRVRLRAPGLRTGHAIGARRGAVGLAQDDGGEVRRLGAVCVGAFLLAEAGLLNGRRATAHWRFGRELAARYPGVRVEHEPLWVKDGNIYTSAGISASIDLALAWVEEDCGAGLAHEAARELVLFLRRPGGQPQVSVSLASQASEMSVDPRAADLDRRAPGHEAVGRGARGADVDERAQLRARLHPRSRHDAVAVRAADARGGGAPSARAHGRRPQAGGRGGGFGSVDVMRRAFVRLLGITPRRYRELATSP